MSTASEATSRAPTLYRRAQNAAFSRLYPQTGDSQWLDTFIITLITFNVVAVMLETEPVVAETYAPAFNAFETFSSLFFTFEYLSRVWVAPLRLELDRPWRSRARYVFSFMAMVDLIAVVPFYLPMFIKMDLRIVRAIRLLRLFRILKMGRYAHAVNTMANVADRKKEELAMTGFILVMLLVLCSSAVYFVEHDAQPDQFRSIPASMWWAVITLTSVGYGDVYPVTAIGQVVGALVALVGVGFVALPTGILAAGFAEEIRDQRLEKGALNTPGFCPHCGKPVIPEAENDD